MDFLVVDLQKRHFHGELQVFVRVQNIFEDVLHHSGNYAFVFERIDGGPLKKTKFYEKVRDSYLHCEGFPARRLPVRENRAVEAAHHTFFKEIRLSSKKIRVSAIKINYFLSRDEQRSRKSGFAQFRAKTRDQRKNRIYSRRR